MHPLGRSGQVVGKLAMIGGQTQPALEIDMFDHNVPLAEDRLQCFGKCPSAQRRIRYFDMTIKDQGDVYLAPMGRYPEPNNGLLQRYSNLTGRKCQCTL